MPHAIILHVSHLMCCIPLCHMCHTSCMEHVIIPHVSHLMCRIPLYHMCRIPLYHMCPTSCSSSSSSSSQERPMGPLPAKCWPEAFHATFIHNIRERGKAERMEEKLRYHYPYHHNYLPPPLAPQLLQMKMLGEENRKQESQKTQSHSHSCSFRSRPVFY